MVKTITITNRKGGVGKTTMAVHLAAGLASIGHHVGIIDTDSQGHVALMFGIEQANDLFDVMIDGAALAERLVVVPPDLYSTTEKPSKGNLYMLRGYDKTFKIPHEMEPTDAFLFLDTVEAMSELAKLDYVVIDSQPTITQFDAAIYMATDAFLYVTELEALAISGLVEAIEQMGRFNRTRLKYLGKETKILGIIPNKMRTNTVVHQHNITLLAEEFGAFEKNGVYQPDGLVMSPMRLLTVWTQAGNERIPMYTFEPDGEGSRDMWRIVYNVEKRMKQWSIAATE